MRYVFTSLLFVLSTAVLAQKTIDNPLSPVIESPSQINAERTMQYRPDDGGFVCVNGKNRYTRALYGGYTDYRIETSDRPVFAIYKKGTCRNISMRVIYRGKSVPLDSTDYCRASYKDGMRTYQLSDCRWGKARLDVKIMALPDKEGAIWQFSAHGFDSHACIEAVVRKIKKPKLKRNGDLGMDAPDCFDADDTDRDASVTTLPLDKLCYMALNEREMSCLPESEGHRTFVSVEDYDKNLTHRIVFDTPDKYINTLGGALVLAADGVWDGQTWLHGAIGWRMPLAGWRAGFLGDVLGWNDRALSHFSAYAASQVTDVPPVIPSPSQDTTMNMARAVKKWGTQMYSNGYICRNPNNNHQMHHYDMNLNYMDELMWHFCYDADTTYMRRMWRTIKSHLAWEKRNFDADGDHLYDAYCCIWASDALYYNAGGVTHASAYNYRANRMAARIARLIGENPRPYDEEANAILAAMNSRLWLPKEGHWAEYVDAMGLKRTHNDAAVWSVYVPVDCGAATPEQAFLATGYVDERIPHFDVAPIGNNEIKDEQLFTVSTSDWMPYSWSINNVAPAEVMHTALSFFEAGRADEAFRMMKGNIIDQMYMGASPANFGQLSYYDAACGECYRDFGDVVGISARTLIQGLFGIVPDAIDGKCIIRPGFPEKWNHASVITPYLSYTYKRKGNKMSFVIHQKFHQKLKIIVRINKPNGEYEDYEGTQAASQTMEMVRECHQQNPRALVKKAGADSLETALYGLDEPALDRTFHQQNIDQLMNARVSDIFNNKYLSPRPQSTSLEIPVQGVGEWCHPLYKPEINDSVLRSLIHHDEYVVAGVPFRMLPAGNNIVFTSLWDNYPDSISVPLSGRYADAYLLLAGRVPTTCRRPLTMRWSLLRMRMALRIRFIL
jgi:hypothetical protein